MAEESFVGYSTAPLWLLHHRHQTHLLVIEACFPPYRLVRHAESIYRVIKVDKTSGKLQVMEDLIGASDQLKSLMRRSDEKRLVRRTTLWRLVFL